MFFCPSRSDWPSIAAAAGQVGSAIIPLASLIKCEKNVPTHVVVDSREGWCDAFYAGLNVWFNGMDIDFDLLE